MLQINDFWSNLSAEVLNFSGMSADMFAALLYAVVSIGNLHQGPNLFAVLALPFLSWWNEHLSTLTKTIASFSSFSHCLQRLDTSSRWARVALLICQHSNSDYVTASVMHPVKFKSSRIAITVSKGLLPSFRVFSSIQHILQIADRNQWGATVLHWQACSGLTMHSMHEPMQTLTRPKVSSIKGSVLGSCPLWGYV